MQLNKCALALALALPAVGASGAEVILQNFNGMSAAEVFPFGSGGYPSDMAGAVGGNSVVQMVNGGFKVWDKSGSVLQAAISDIQFWNDAGIGAVVTRPGLSDPRVIYDAASQRFYVAQINVDQTPNVGNQLLFAVSRTSNPLDGFRATSFAAFGRGSAPLADFPTLGVTGNAVILSTNNFSNNTTFDSVSVFNIPKVDALLNTGPSLANMTRFDGLNPSARGFTLQAASGAANGGYLVATDNDVFNVINITKVNGAGGAGATLAAPVNVGGILDGTPNNQRQPGRSRVLDGGDDRFGSSIYQVGNLIYLARGIGSNNSGTGYNVVSWLILDATTDTVVRQGSIADPIYDFTFPAIAANASGDFMLAYNRSGTVNPDGNISVFATVCHNFGTVCDTPLLVQQGLIGNYNGLNRWGDYNAAQVDPDDPTRFWGFVGYPLQNGQLSFGNWGTRIFQIGPDSLPPSVPEPGTLGLLAAGALGLAFMRRRQAAR